MRRLLPLGFLLSLLVSCGPLTQGLQPEEVLRNAAQKSSELLSAHFTVDAEYAVTSSTMPTTGTAKLTGALQDGGEQVSFTLDAAAQMAPEGGESFTITATSDVFLVGKEEVYFRLSALSVDPASDLFKEDLLQYLLNKWWFLPSSAAQEKAPAADITPPPSLIRAQSQVVQVTKDLGMTEINGREAYHYAVTVDAAKLLAYLEQVAVEQQQPFDRTATEQSLSTLQADGELWIDAETFFVQKIIWNIKSFALGEDLTLNGTFTASLTDHNAVPPLTLPQDAKLLTPLNLFGSQAGSSGLGELQKLMEEQPAAPASAQ
ncbi:MAG: hypothetical protein PHI23_01830 [Candidatus Peribacteraceae bacterium]|nr:hypothetical protein [Candidatus Peribacteraceae bacterium]